MIATGAWLSLTMSLLPLFIPSLAANVGTLQWRSISGWEWVTPQLALAGVVGLWLLSGVKSYFMNDMELSLADVVAFVVADDLAVVVAVDLAVVVAAGVAFGVAIDLADVVAFVVAFAVALGVAFGVAGGVVDVVSDMLASRVKEGKASVMSVLVGLAVPASLAVLTGVSFFGWGA